jgi:hypothetical protein
MLHVPSKQGLQAHERTAHAHIYIYILYILYIYININIYIDTYTRAYARTHLVGGEAGLAEGAGDAVDIHEGRHDLVASRQAHAHTHVRHTYVYI